MKPLSFWKKSLYSGLIFFWTVIMLTLVYAGVTNVFYSDLPNVNSGSGLAATSWNDLVKYANKAVKQDSEILTVTGGKVGIGTTSPSDILTVNGGIVATNFTSPTGWTPIPTTTGWTSHASCRKIGSFLQINWYFEMTTSAMPWWNSTVATLPANCMPSSIVYDIPGSCWDVSTTTSACFSSIYTNGTIGILTSSTLRYFAITGTYPAN